MVKKINGKGSLIIKSYRTTSWTDQKTGKEKSKYGPMYVHFNWTCLKKYDTERFYAQDRDFDGTQMSVNKETVKDFNERENIFSRNLALHF